MLIHNADITGSLTINGIPFNSGSFSGSFRGDGSQLTGITGATTASYVEYSNIGNKPALVSGSSQITYSGLTGIPSGIVSGSAQVSFNGIVDKPTLVSGSSQVSFNGITDKPTLVSGSAQISYPNLSNIPNGIVSSSTQITGYNIFATTGSNTFNGTQTITGSIFGTGSLTIDGCITATGQIVAQTINVQQVTSSIVYSCGSNIFGTDISNTQQFTGSMLITGSNITANVGSACFQGSVCAPSFIGDVQSSILCSNTINLSGNNNALACNNTLRFTDTDTATELNQQIGKIEFFSCDSSTPGAGVKAYIGAFAADSTPDAYIAFATQDGSGTPNPVERLRISSEGFACFQNTVCAPAAIFSGCVGIGTPTAATPLHIVTAGLPTIRLTLGSEARCHNINGVNLGRDLQVLPFRHFSVQTGNGIAEGQIVLNAYEDFIVGTGASYTSRLTITPTGIACFACQVCAPAAIFSGCVGIGITTPSYDLTLSKSVAAGNVILNIENTSTTGAARLWFGNNVSSTGARIQYFGATHAARPNLFSIGTDGANDMMFETTGTERARITSTGIACFACQVCAPCVLTNSTILGSVNGPANNILRIYRGVGASNYSEITNIGGTTYVRANGITGVAASLELQTKQDDWADFCSRLTIVGNGIACFACQVCAPRFVGPLTGNVNGYPIIAQTSCLLGGVSADVTVYFTSSIAITYGINDYTVSSYLDGNSAVFSSLRALIPYNYYASSTSTVNLASYIDGIHSHSVLAVAICKLANSNTNCIAVRFARSSDNVSGYRIVVTSNGMYQG